jgi:hypothetical protein
LGKYVFPILFFCTKKNLATLVVITFNREIKAAAQKATSKFPQTRKKHLKEKPQMLKATHFWVPFVVFFLVQKKRGKKKFRIAGIGKLGRIRRSRWVGMPAARNQWLLHSAARLGEISPFGRQFFGIGLYFFQKSTKTLPKKL